MEVLCIGSSIFWKSSPPKWLTTSCKQPLHSSPGFQVFFPVSQKNPERLAKFPVSIFHSVILKITDVDGCGGFPSKTLCLDFHQSDLSAKHRAAIHVFHRFISHPSTTLVIAAKCYAPKSPGSIKHLKNLEFFRQHLYQLSTWSYGPHHPPLTHTPPIRFVSLPLYHARAGYPTDVVVLYTPPTSILELFRSRRWHVVSLSPLPRVAAPPRETVVDGVTWVPEGS
jgi:hypothetical protein